MGSGPRVSSFVPVSRGYSRLRRRHLEWSGRRAPDDGGFLRPFCLLGLQLFDCLVVTLALFVEVGASQHGKQVVRPGERKGVHHGATN